MKKEVKKEVKKEMDSVIVEQIIAIRDSGKTNMFDANMVQRLAFDAGYYELVMFIENDKYGYIGFILHGK